MPPAGLATAPSESAGPAGSAAVSAIRTDRIKERYVNIRTDECRTGQIGEAEIYILKVAIIEIGICQFGVRKVDGLENPPRVRCSTGLHC